MAKTEASVLITGENGTGKELVARELYRNSMLSKEPYIRVNCAAISETLMESEFFGHERGAYTGATERREGRFELADGGTILLDEISEIAPSLQAKLLRVLQEWEFERVGGNKTIQVKVRVLATTNRDLTEEVEKGNFREDLYYRLNVFPIAVPPLRERGDDILLLANTFLLRHARRHGREKISFSKNCEKAIQFHNWPETFGNLKMRWKERSYCPIPAKKLKRNCLVWEICPFPLRPRKALQRAKKKLETKRRSSPWRWSKNATLRRFWPVVMGTVLMPRKNLV